MKLGFFKKKIKKVTFEQELLNEFGNCNEKKIHKQKMERLMMD